MMSEANVNCSNHYFHDFSTDGGINVFTESHI